MFSNIVFYGRTWGEYEDMFALKVGNLSQLKVLDCPGGPSSFQVHAKQLGIDVVSVDPMYAKSKDELEVLAKNDIAATIEKTKSKGVASLEYITQMEEKRNQCLEDFLGHYEDNDGRYVAASLPTLPFDDNTFDVVLSGNLSFCYSSQQEDGLMEEGGLDLAWHREALSEMVRVAKTEVRVYPAFSMTTMMTNFPTVAHHQYAEILCAEFENSGQCKCEFYNTVADGVATIGLKITKLR